METETGETQAPGSGKGMKGRACLTRCPNPFLVLASMLFCVFVSVHYDQTFKLPVRLWRDDW